MLKDELGIDIFITPPYNSQAKDQVKRFHSRLVNIMRRTKENGGHKSFEELLERAVSEYNHSCSSCSSPSATGKRPVDLFFDRNFNHIPDGTENHFCKKD